MILRLCATCAALLAVGACDDASDSRTIAGQYTLLTVDGIGLSDYTMEDSTGTLVILASGGLDLCGDGRYEIHIIQRYENGDSQAVVVSSGEYAWDGVTLTLVDSGSVALLTASVAGGVIIVQTDDHEYEFLKLVQLPPRTAPECGPVTTSSRIASSGSLVIDHWPGSRLFHTTHPPCTLSVAA
jgi:hypothetical protein